MADNSEDEVQGKKERSPSFPFISLKKAIDRAEAFANSHGKAAARLVAVGPTWGYAEKSSGLLQTVAALKQYGLIEDFGSGAERKVQLTELAWRILKDMRPGAREQAIGEAVLKPRLMQEYIAHWIPDRPSDAHCISELTLDRGFTEASAKAFLKVFDENASFANLKNSDSLSPSLENEETIPAFHKQDTGKDMQQRYAPQSISPVVGPNRAIFPLAEGTAILELPIGLSQESKEDLEAWFDLMLKRASRPAKTEE